MRPLYAGAARKPEKRPPGGHAGLWFDKFCNQWNVQGSSWSMGSRTDHDEGPSKRREDGRNRSPKLAWIDTVTDSRIGAEPQIGEFASRMVTLIERRGGRFAVFTSESRFVTGLGRSHPVENGFAWHPTLGTPCLPGSSIKGMVRAWTKRDADPPVPSGVVKRLLGGPGSAGGISFLDAVPVAPVQLESDVMTPHHAGWTEQEPPGDWRSPVPVPFLVTASGTALLFGIVPRGAVAGEDLDDVMAWLCLALAWCGSGAKTAVGYGRFQRDDAKTNDLKRRLQDREREQQERTRKQREAEEQAARLAAMPPVHREIEKILEERPDKKEPAVTTIIRSINEGRWSGSERTEAARWLEHRMRAEKQWKEKSGAKNPAKDRNYQRTRLVKDWLAEQTRREGGC